MAEGETVLKPIRPRAWRGDELQLGNSRSRTRPRKIAWFGFRSFWGHLRHFVASAIATENVDSRDWMVADEPDELVDRIIEQLELVPAPGLSLSEQLGGDVWIDYVADTGDDAGVMRSVADLIVRDYELPDPRDPEVLLDAPRGSVLLFGGDTAYPVATVKEITNRVLVPFNEVLQERDDGKQRVLMGIPGNHDWYDGLDGFGRLFRRRRDGESESLRASTAKMWKLPFESYAEWTKQFIRGGQVEKPARLILLGYEPVQAASYFGLPVSPGVDLLAADRQLKHIDPKQQHYFESWGQTRRTKRWVVLPDPVFPFGEPSDTGVRMIHFLNLDLDAEPHLVLTGDIHHYSRYRTGPTTHIIAGGGGAFSHPARVAPREQVPADVEWPDVEQCKRLLFWVPGTMMVGGSGFIPHAVLGLLFLPVILVSGYQFYSGLIAALIVSTIFGLLVGAHRQTRAGWLLALPFGLTTAALPTFATMAVQGVWGGATTMAAHLGIWLASIMVGAWWMGCYLSLCTLLGIEHTQAFTALGYRGFKHFMRIRVRADGSGMDLWCIGKADPLNPEEEIVLVDTVAWETEPAVTE